MSKPTIMTEDWLDQADRAWEECRQLDSQKVNNWEEFLPPNILTALRASLCGEYQVFYQRGDKITEQAYRESIISFNTNWIRAEIKRGSCTLSVRKDGQRFSGFFISQPLAEVKFAFKDNFEMKLAKALAEMDHRLSEIAHDCLWLLPEMSGRNLSEAYPDGHLFVPRKKRSFGTGRFIMEANISFSTKENLPHREGVRLIINTGISEFGSPLFSLSMNVTFLNLDKIGTQKANFLGTEFLFQSEGNMPTEEEVLEIRKQRSLFIYQALTDKIFSIKESIVVQES